MSAGTDTICCGLVIFAGPLCLARKWGTTAFNGNSNSTVSCADVAGGVGLIHERRFPQVNVTRPRFNADAIKFTGNATWAFAEVKGAISERSASGQFSESAASGTMATACADTAGVVMDAGIGIGATTGTTGAAGTTGAVGTGGVMGRTGTIGTTGFVIVPLPAPLPLCDAETTLGVGVICRGVTGSGGGATGGGRNWADAVVNGAAICIGGVVDGFGDFAGVADISIPCPCLPNGPVISSGTSTIFWTALRARRLGLNRAKTSFNGNTTGSESYSS